MKLNVSQRLESLTPSIIDFLELKSAARGYYLIRKILDVVEQFILQNCPIAGFHDAARLRDIISDQTNLDLRIGAIDGCPRFRRLQAESLDTGNKFADDKFKVFLIAFPGDVPCH